jgi:hypothetical protein
MSIDDIKNGQRINCHGVDGTVIGKRSTRNRSLVLLKMDNTQRAHAISGIAGELRSRCARGDYCGELGG